jgi:hypothetical protein
LVSKQQTSRSPSSQPLRVALMWRGNWRMPDQPTNHPERLAALTSALSALAVETRPVVYFDEDIPAARAALLECDGVLVWINPLQDGLRDRSKVDPLLREIASAGVWVSAHPDAILRMGTKEVLYRTRDLGWGADTDVYATHDEFALRFPVKLAVAGPRVLKPMRGNDGRGVTKVEAEGKERVRIQSASDDRIEALLLKDFVNRMRESFTRGGLIDQAFQPNVGAGMVRCYMSLGRVAGFSEQRPRADDARPGAPPFGMNSAKAMHGADAPHLQDLRALMEQEWTPGLQTLLGLETASLPALWDADFLLRPDERLPGSPRFMLCEINVSSVLPFPQAAALIVAETVRSALQSARDRRRGR